MRQGRRSRRFAYLRSCRLIPGFATAHLATIVVAPYRVSGVSAKNEQYGIPIDFYPFQSDIQRAFFRLGLF